MTRCGAQGRWNPLARDVQEGTCASRHQLAPIPRAEPGTHHMHSHSHLQGVPATAHDPASPDGPTRKRAERGRGPHVGQSAGRPRGDGGRPLRSSPRRAPHGGTLRGRPSPDLSSDLASAYYYSLYAERPPPAPEPSPGAPTPFGASPPFVSASSSLPSTFLDAPTPVSTPLGSGGLPRARATSPTQAYGSGASMGSGTFSGPRSPRNSKEVAEL